jgi:hypothetical protein
MKMSARRRAERPAAAFRQTLQRLHQIQNSYDIMEFVLDRLPGLFARRVMSFSSTKEQAE